MKKIKMITGIAWALLALILMLIFFPGYTRFAEGASKLPFMKINPRLSGGDPAYKIIHDNCTTVVRKPVFNGLLKETENGFVQVDWRGRIPEVINDTIDYDQDKSADFIITVNTAEKKDSLLPVSPKVKNINISTGTSYGWSVRVNIKK